MKHCVHSDSRRSFIVKGAALAALYLTPSILVQSYAADAIVPTPIAKEKIDLTINGSSLHLEVDPRISLLDLLREQVGYTGTKKGCDIGQCGACIVHVNGKRANSCLSLAVDNNGNKITTIEGLANGEVLHPMQEAFLQHDSFQCGYCTPGQIMSAITCVREGKATTKDSIRNYMDSNICRCGSYQNIVDAIYEVAKSGKKI